MHVEEVQNVQTLHTNTHSFCPTGNLAGTLKVTQSINKSHGLQGQSSVLLHSLNHYAFNFVRSGLANHFLKDAQAPFRVLNFSDGRVVRMWVRILAATMVLVYLSKILLPQLLLSSQE